jgi:hypothetical protein
MGNIKNPHTLADGGVLSKYACAGILNWHHPPTKISHLGVEV